MLVKTGLLNRVTLAFYLASCLLLWTGCNTNEHSDNQRDDQQRGQQQVQKKSPIVSADLIPESAEKMKQVMLALLSFHDDKKRFPAAYTYDDAGKPLLSWRVHLLPYLGQTDLYSQFHLEEPWDSNHNKKLIDKMPDVFRAPDSLAENGKTIFRGIGGESGMFRLPRQPGSKTGNKIATVLDGTVNTVMIVESSDALAIEWTRPGTLAPGGFDHADLFGRYSGGTNMAFVGGSVKFISDAITPKQLTLYLMKNDGADMENLAESIQQQELERQSDPKSFEQRVMTETGELKELFRLSSKIEAKQLTIGAVQMIRGAMTEQDRLRQELDILQKEYFQLLDKFLSTDSQ